MDGSYLAHGFKNHFLILRKLNSVQTLACEHLKVARQAKKKSMALGVIKKHI